METKTMIFKDELLQSMADELKANGLKVYYHPDNERLATWFYFTDGVNIGYCQSGYFGGLRFSTVHKPCRECGTGFGLTDDPGIYEPTIQDAKKAFVFAPIWAKAKDVKAVVKYKNWDEKASKEPMLRHIEY